MGIALRANVNAEGSKLFHNEKFADKSPKHYKITSFPGYAVLSEVRYTDDKNWTFSYRNKGANASTLGASVSDLTISQLGRIFIKPGSRYAIGRVNTHDIIIVFDEALSSTVDYTAIGQITFNKVKKNNKNTYSTFINEVHVVSLTDKTPA